MWVCVCEPGEHILNFADTSPDIHIHFVITFSHFIAWQFLPCIPQIGSSNNKKTIPGILSSVGSKYLRIWHTPSDGPPLSSSSIPQHLWSSQASRHMCEHVGGMVSFHFHTEASFIWPKISLMCVGENIKCVHVHMKIDISGERKNREIERPMR